MLVQLFSALKWMYSSCKRACQRMEMHSGTFEFPAQQLHVQELAGRSCTEDARHLSPAATGAR